MFHDGQPFCFLHDLEFRAQFLPTAAYPNPSIIQYGLMGQGTMDPMRSVRMGQLRRLRPCRHRWVRLDNPMQVVLQRATTPVLDNQMELTTLCHEHENRP
jgi:hypothetical protein